MKLEFCGQSADQMFKRVGDADMVTAVECVVVGCRLAVPNVGEREDDGAALGETLRAQGESFGRERGNERPLVAVEVDLPVGGVRGQCPGCILSYFEIASSCFEVSGGKCLLCTVYPKLCFFVSTEK